MIAANALCVRWGLISTARINRSLIPAIRASTRSRLVAVASRTAEAAEAYARAWDIPLAFGSYQAMLDSDAIDAVYLSLPNALHAEWSIRALRAGKHVLCEKPLATSEASLLEMIALARAQRLVLAEAFMYRHHPQTLMVQSLVRDGRVGEVRLVKGAFTFSIANENDVRLDPSLDGGSLWDVGCYPLSYARMIYGREPARVMGLAYIGPSGVDEAFVAQLAFDNQAYAQFDCGFRAPFRTHIEIVGSKGMIVVPAPFNPGPRETIYVGDASDRLEALPVEGPELLYLGEVEDVVSAILDGTPPRVSLEDSLGNLRAMRALFRSAQEARAVML